ncbi:MAG: hypothetical protein K2X38_05485 [Gemmataceae bacterium]|nr:hypothetical protein [Gemmataceae bacterium]
MFARILPLTALVPVILAACLMRAGAAKPRAIAESEVVSYTDLLKQAEAESGESEPQEGETVIIASND